MARKSKKDLEIVITMINFSHEWHTSTSWAAPLDSPLIILGALMICPGHGDGLGYALFVVALVALNQYFILKIFLI